MMVRGTARALDEVDPIDAGAGGARPGREGRWRGQARAVGMLVAWAALSATAAMARDPDPMVRIPLGPMGYQALAPEFLLAGSSMLTVHFVDKDHLLITFNVRRLMKREVDPPPDDDDRTIGAFLAELPSGKVLARTEWRVHDRLQYLWSLGHGRFLLRVRDRLTVVAPMAAANPDEAFREAPLLHIERHIIAIVVSSDGDLLTVETTRRPVGAGSTADDLTRIDPAPVQINFYRLVSTDESANTLGAVGAGAIRTRSAVAIPMTTSGFLNVLEGGKASWLFNFDEHTGKVRELAGFDTTCFPHATFVGHGEFVAFGCRGSADKVDFAGFNLKGEEMWQQNFSDTHVSPTFAFAPAAGRFALGRTIVNGPFDPESPLPSGAVTAQEVRVYQSYDGKQLFRIECAPVERAGQNFAISPDGMELAVVRQPMVRHVATKDEGAYTDQKAAVEVYALPGLSDKDRVEVKMAESLAPADTGARIDLSLQRLSAPATPDAAVVASDTQKPSAATSSDAAAGGVPAAAASLAGEASPPGGGPAAPGAAGETGGAAAAATATGTGPGSVASGDGEPEPAAPRKPPTLYGPDEKQKRPPK
jgi:hypothetical protein